MGENPHLMFGLARNVTTHNAEEYIKTLKPAIIFKIGLLSSLIPNSQKMYNFISITDSNLSLATFNEAKYKLQKKKQNGLK